MNGKSQMQPAAGWLLVAPMVLAKSAWAARGTYFRGEWSLGTLIGALAVVAVLLGLGLFFAWPGRR
jgi:hypothetical protein